MKARAMFKDLYELSHHLDNLPSKQRTFKSIFKLMNSLSLLDKLLAEGYNMDDIAFAMKRRTRLEHHLCPVCGREIHVYKLQRYPKTCSISCGNRGSQEMRKKLSLERYGVESPHQLRRVKGKKAKTMLERHGGHTF